MLRPFLVGLSTLLSFTRAQNGSPTVPSSPTVASSPNSPLHTIAVGKDGTTKFDPEISVVTPGSKVVFQFYPGHHSVVQGSFDKPCSPTSNLAFYSGKVDIDSGPASQIFTVAVDDPDPIWFYCGSGSHCEEGEVGVINPSPNKTLAMYLSGVSKANKTTLPVTNNIQGGVLNSTTPTSAASTMAKEKARIVSISLLSIASSLLSSIFIALS
ncbi:hypothetical protein FKW77_002894 [Venturia effusa]|uniref:Phytocyanin domain-containing protein n=1 Tax=Venturia effusa TaxID=50376 RepID=A0A517LIC4_9PEZI|nr:hypothetical protein FKW77_002894 [Venturia effusa]